MKIKFKKIMTNFTERSSKCYTGVIHDIMRDMEYTNFTLPPELNHAKTSMLSLVKFLRLKEK